MNYRPSGHCSDRYNLLLEHFRQVLIRLRCRLDSMRRVVRTTAQWPGASCAQGPYEIDGGLGGTHKRDGLHRRR